MGARDSLVRLARASSLPADRLRGGLPARSPGADGRCELLGAGRAVKFRPAFVLASYVCALRGRAPGSSCSAASSSPSRRRRCRLLIAYPSPIFWPARSRPATARIVLLLFTVPFLINYIVRDVSPGPSFSAAPARQHALMAAGLIDAPLDWLLYSDFAVLRRADLVLHALHDLSAVDVDRRHRPAVSRGERAARCHRRSRTFRQRHAAAVAAGHFRRRPSSASSAALAKAPCRSSWAASAIS